MGKFILFISIEKLMIQDKRIVKTQESLKKALVTLLIDMPFSTITIQDICSEAKVTRVTFYKHYNTKESLLLDYVTDCIKDIFHFGNELPSMKGEHKVRYVLTTIFARLLSMINDNPLVSKSLASKGDKSLLDALELVAVQQGINYLDSLLKDDINSRYSSKKTITFILGGSIQLLYNYAFNKHYYDDEEQSFLKEGLEMIDDCLNSLQ